MRPAQQWTSTKGNGLTRPLSLTKPVVINPLGLHPTAEFASSWRVSSRPSSAQEQVEESQAHLVRASLLGSCEIDEKVQEMLATSDALKATRREQSSRVDTLQRRGTARVLNKVTNAWERLHVRSPVPGPVE